MKRNLLAVCTAVCLIAGAPAAIAASAPTTWDDLVKVPSKRLDAVYLLPGADFRPYTKVMLDPTEAAFRKNWARDYNNSSRQLSSRISDKDIEKALEQVRDGFQKILAKACADGGLQVVTQPGPDVLRLRTGVVNLHVNAPERMTAGRSRSYAPEAGSATLVIEARDSETGALMGRAVDSRITGDMGPAIRNSVTNRADFEQLFKTWAKASVNGLNTLKASPAPPGAG